MDAAGDHALSCPSNGTYRRHNHLRDRLFGLGQLAGWAPELEQAIPGSRDRPADLLFRAAGPRPLATDVTVSHPLRPSASTAVREGRSSAAAEAERAKVVQSKGARRPVGTSPHSAWTLLGASGQQPVCFASGWQKHLQCGLGQTQRPCRRTWGHRTLSPSPRGGGRCSAGPPRCHPPSCPFKDPVCWWRHPKLEATPPAM